MTDANRLARAVAAVTPPGGVEPLVPIVALVREAIGQLGWSTMLYTCDSCGFSWRVWATLGVEGPAGLRAAGLFVPSPFTFPCPSWPVKPGATPADKAMFRHLTRCEGTMSHTDFQSDEEFPPLLIPDDAPRFVLDHWYDSAKVAIPEPALVRARKFHAEDDL